MLCFSEFGKPLQKLQSIIKVVETMLEDDDGDLSVKSLEQLQKQLSKETFQSIIDTFDSEVYLELMNLMAMCYKKAG